MDKTKIVIWLPRIISIIFVLFLAMFSLDVFEPGRSVQEIAVGLFMHNIPALIMLAVVIVSWRREIVGAAAFATAGIFYIVILLKSGFEWYMVSWVLAISGPALVVSSLYFFAWLQNRKIKSKENTTSTSV